MTKPDMMLKLKSGNWVLISQQDLTERQLTDDGKRLIVHLWAKELHLLPLDTKEPTRDRTPFG